MSTESAELTRLGWRIWASLRPHSVYIPFDGGVIKNIETVSCDYGFRLPETIGVLREAGAAGGRDDQAQFPPDSHRFHSGA